MVLGMSCDPHNVVTSQGVVLDALRWDGQYRCNSCGVAPGGFHHAFCDNAICPHHDHQMGACGCDIRKEGDIR